MYVFRYLGRPTMSDPLGTGVRGSCKLPMQVLGIEFRCSGRRIYALNHQAISLTYIFFSMLCMDVHHFCAEHSVAKEGIRSPGTRPTDGPVSGC